MLARDVSLKTLPVQLTLLPTCHDLRLLIHAVPFVERQQLKKFRFALRRVRRRGGERGERRCGGGATTPQLTLDSSDRIRATLSIVRFRWSRYFCLSNAGSAVLAREPGRALAGGEAEEGSGVVKLQIEPPGACVRPPVTRPRTPTPPVATPTYQVLVRA